MYESVEMLLKFYVENFPFEFTGQESREKSIPAHARISFKLKISHWRRRYFTRAAPDDRILFALVDSSSTILKFFAGQFSRAVWKGP
jgi:hypothetical protein